MLIDFRNLFPKYNLTFSGVLHIGANVGEERNVYKELGIYRQIWFEANPEIFKQLEKNISDNPEAKAFNFAVGDMNGNAILNISNNNSQSSSILQLGLHKNEHPDVHYIDQIEVPMIRIESLFRPTGVAISDERFNLDGIDFLNIDVQGYELQVLKGMGNFLHQFKAAYLELNATELYVGCALIDEIDEYMNRFGFKRVETKFAPNKSWADGLFIKS